MYMDDHLLVRHTNISKYSAKISESEAKVYYWLAVGAKSMAIKTESLKPKKQQMQPSDPMVMKLRWQKNGDDAAAMVIKLELQTT